ncbi:hypothetical protein NL529_31000, partial [Klebsiella pneumoniae]|nr:hypothetical protein [Klebsiella pneumoniae]
RVKALNIDNVAPTRENIIKKRYRIVRPFIFLTNGEPNAHAQKFLAYVLSKDGQGILRKEGLIGVHD